jgi:tRNA (guanine-N7-)-methyltransferase
MNDPQTRTAPLTFKPRRRRLSPRRAEAYERGRGTLLADSGDLLAFSALVQPSDEIVLDIGFGGGESVIALACERPHQSIIGVEVHTPGVARVLADVEALGLTNVRVVEGDALRFLDRVPVASLAGVRIWFPDPWPKVRQRDKRIVQPGVVTRLVDRLRPDGELHLATDVADYATQMAAVCAGEPRLSGGVIDRPAWRPLTRFEQRGVDEGRTAVDLVYRRA